MHIFALRKTNSENVLLRRYLYRNVRRVYRRQQIARRTVDDFTRCLSIGRRWRADVHADDLFSWRIQIRGVLPPLSRDRSRVLRGLELRLPDFRRPGDGFTNAWQALRNISTKVACIRRSGAVNFTRSTFPIAASGSSRPICWDSSNRKRTIRSSMSCTKRKGPHCGPRGH